MQRTNLGFFWSGTLSWLNRSGTWVQYNVLDSGQSLLAVLRSLIPDSRLLSYHFWHSHCSPCVGRGDLFLGECHSLLSNSQLWGWLHLEEGRVWHTQHCHVGAQQIICRNHAECKIYILPCSCFQYAQRLKLLSVVFFIFSILWIHNNFWLFFETHGLWGTFIPEPSVKLVLPFLSILSVQTDSPVGNN